MGFLEDLTKKASGIVSKGKNFLTDQLSSKTVYERDASGTVQQKSTTGNKPQILGTVKEFLIPGRGYTDKEIASAPKPTIKQTATGVAKVAGEIVQGGLSLTHMLGNTIADATIPGYNGEKSKAYREKINEPISEKLAPKSASEAKVMRVGDLLGFAAAPIKATKLSKLDDLSDVAKNSLKNDTNGIREKTLTYLREDPKRVQEGEVRLREIEDGSIVIEDGRHRLQVGAETGVKPNIVDVTAEYTGKPSEKIARIQREISEIKDVVPSKNKDEFERAFSKRVRVANPDANLTPQMDTRRNTAQLAARAKEIVKNGDQQSYLDDIRSDKNVTDEHIAVASQLLNRYKQELDSAPDMGRKNEIYESMADVAHDTAARLTEAGRTIQAATILGNVTPEGALRRAARQINKYNADNPSKPPQKLTTDQTRIIYKEKEEINNMPMGEERAMREFFFNDALARLTPSSKADMISNTWKAGLLTGLKTTGLNIASNASHFITELIKDVPSVGVDIISALFTGQRTKALTTRGLTSGAGEGFGKGWRYLKTGFDERNVGGKLDFKPMNFGNSKTAKAFQAYTDVVFRTIGSQDQPFYYAAAKHSLWSQALATGINKKLKGSELIEFARDLVKNPTEDILKRSVTDAQMVVFQNKTELGRLAKGIQNAKIAGIPVGQFVVPFAQTPSAVAMQIINYSPVGAVKTIIQNIGKGKFDQKAFSDGIGRSIVGTAPLAIGAALYENGMISLEYPSGNEREIELNKAEGQTYNAIKFTEDGKWRSIITLGPAGNLLLFGAYFQKALNESGSLSEAMYTGGFGALSSFTEQTFMTGFNKFTEFIQDPVRYGESYLPNLAASAIPTIISDVAKANDPGQRNSRGENFVDSLKTRAMNRLPGVRNQLPVSIDALGNQVPRGTGPIESMIDPTRPSEDISTPLTEELRRLTEEGFAVSPTKIGTSKGYASLNTQQEQDFYETVGSNVKEKLEILTSDELYQNLSDNERASIIEKITTKAKNQGAAIYVLQQTDSIPLEAQEEILLKLKEDGILNSDVFRAYKKLIQDDII